MNVLKTNRLTEEIESAIQQGKFSDRLPTIRELAAHFGVAKQTIANALKPLRERGFLMATPNGTFINSQLQQPTRNTKMIGLFSNSSPAEVGNFEGTMFQELGQLMRDDGYEPIFILTDSQRIPANKFFSSMHVDGLIFVYSSFEPDLVPYLQQNAIPFLSGTRVPETHKASWVEFDHAYIYERILGVLRSVGYRRIAIDHPFVMHINGLIGEMFEEWRKVYEKFNLPYQGYIEQVNIPACPLAEPMVRERALQLAALAEFPEAIICWHGRVEITIATLEEAGKRLNRDYIIVAPQVSGASAIPGVYYVSGYDYRLLDEAIWETFKQILPDPFGPVRQVRVPVNVRFIETPVRLG